jgi:hypothetical protein
VQQRLLAAEPGAAAADGLGDTAGAALNAALARSPAERALFDAMDRDGGALPPYAPRERQRERDKEREPYGWSQGV